MEVVRFLQTSQRHRQPMTTWEMERTRVGAAGGYDDSLQEPGHCARSSLKHPLQSPPQLSGFLEASSLAPSVRLNSGGGRLASCAT